MPPVLLLLFNRPDLTQQLISILASVRPSKVYVAIDGPRAHKPEDEQKVREVREIAHSIEWTKEVKFLERDRNLGCGKAVSSAIDWFFEHEEQGIILEDDIHPSLDFFSFCQEMLNRYAEDERIATIVGYSFLPTSFRHPAGYFFSQYFHMWGWATWKRFWKTYDFGLSSLTLLEWIKIIQNHSKSKMEMTYWLHSLLEAKTKNIWCYQAQFCIWRNQQLNITAASNLISNKGFREDSTHTTADMAQNHGFRKTTSLSGPFPQQPTQVDEEVERKTFICHHVMNEDHLFYLLRMCDPEYTQLKQEVTGLKQELMELSNKNNS